MFYSTIPCFAESVPCTIPQLFGGPLTATLGIYVSPHLHLHSRRHSHSQTPATSVINPVISQNIALFVLPHHLLPGTCHPFVPPSVHASDNHSPPPALHLFLSPRHHLPLQLRLPSVVTSSPPEPAITPAAASHTRAPTAAGHIMVAPALFRHPLRSLVPPSVSSPIIVPPLASLLYHHPDTSLVHFLLSGFHFGFSLGVHGSVRPGSLPNLASCRSNPSTVSNAILTEVSRGHSHGPFPFPPFSPFHAAPIGIVSKKSGSFFLILDLSTNHAGSVNDGIDIDEFSVSYCTLDDAIALVRDAGDSPFMAKLDIKHAFRLCPVRPSEWPLL